MSGKEPIMPSLIPASTNRRRKRRGSAVIELTLLSPWVFFLFIGIIDLSKGPMVFEAPPNALGTFDDM